MDFLVQRISVDHVSQIKDSWEILQKGNDMTVFQTYRWHELQIQWYKNKSRLYQSICKYEIWIVSDNDLPRMIIPIMRCKYKNGIHGLERGLHFIGRGNYSDYCNLIYDKFDCECFECAVKKMRNVYGKTVFYFEGIIENTEFDAWLKRKGMAPNRRKAVFVRIEDSVDAYQKYLSKSTRQNLRTALNRMNKAGIDYKYKVYGIVKDEMLVNRLLSLHLRRNLEKNRKRNFIFNILRKIRQTFLEMRQNIIPSVIKQFEGVWILVVYLNEEIGGYLLGLRDGTVIRVIQNCVNSEYSFYSPSFRVAYDYIVDCIVQNETALSAESVRCIDFTSGDEEYKYRLNGSELFLCDYEMTLEMRSEGWMKFFDYFLGAPWEVLYKKETEQEFRLFRGEKGYWYADPFLFSYHGGLYLFTEAFNEKTQVGKIAVSEFDGKEFYKTTVILDNKYHMSYPNIFCLGEEVYMIPETGENGTLELYTAIHFPYEWEKKILMMGVDYADSTVFEKNGIYYVAAYCESELSTTIYELDRETLSLKRAHYVRHNDKKRRPGGSWFCSNGAWYRPTQNCTVSYGGSLLINRVNDPLLLEEEAVKEVMPSDIGPYEKLHTYNRAGGV